MSLLTIVIDPPAWMADALCAGETDFTEREHHEREPLCRQCPVRKPCLAAEPYGFWGAKEERPIHEVSSHGNARATCKHGHDIRVVGRTAQGRCAECQRSRRRARRRERKRVAA